MDTIYKKVVKTVKSQFYLVSILKINKISVCNALEVEFGSYAWAQVDKEKNFTNRILIIFADRAIFPIAMRKTMIELKPLYLGGYESA